MMPRRVALRPGHHLLSLLLVWIPPLALLLWSINAYVARLNAVLAQSAPLVSAEASQVLGREVHVGRLSPDLTIGGLVRMARSLPTLGTLSIAVDDFALANKKSLADGGALASARHASAVVSVPALLSGDYSSAILSIAIDAPDLLLERRARTVALMFRTLSRPPRPPAESRSVSGSPCRRAA